MDKIKKAFERERAEWLKHNGLELTKAVGMPLALAIVKESAARIALEREAVELQRGVERAGKPSSTLTDARLIVDDAKNYHDAMLTLRLVESLVDAMRAKAMEEVKAAREKGCEDG